MPLVIQVNNIGKLYRLGQINTGTLSHDLNRWWCRLRGKEDPFIKIGEENDHSRAGGSKYTWALRDINFEMNQGEVLGIIGRNGAGKSTLLKILSRTTAPTIGQIKIKGRVASLLEVGTGFHPELTGRENIFLNGAILGMTRTEIKKKFDEIVDFAGVARYVGTPVKRYSSGMYVRLAFAVAAYLEPEVLIVDEVLAVGDAEFQKKALGKMKDVSQNQGRTVLFVSHNMAAVRTLCNKGIVLENGKLVFNGNSTDAVSYYLKGDSHVHNARYFNNEFDVKEFKLSEISLRNFKKSSDQPLVENETIELLTKIYIKEKDSERYHITYHLLNDVGEALFSFYDFFGEAKLRSGENILICKFPAFFFQSGTYYLSFFLVRDNREAIYGEKDIISFTIVDGGRDLGVYMGREPGYIRPQFVWENR
jgi:lipopolysaccharide transport system ATP-binding protein